ncbi:MAG: glycosyltransferase [Candidatus Omnitrophica bacterium]|nr:glycosyltransferase [Candidatus Omnitrophota bacterium]MDD5352436.1 glycosyltransferase [Candidatus Omnitrophota bacterium]MDD5550034.1 glycosyltransferase [Candidatus Omnitrophota bacterium]
MKIFIIHASAGFGHKKIAESIYESAVDIYDKKNVFLLDVLDYTPNFFRFLYSKGYIFIISNMKWLWSILFFLADTKYLRLINGNFRRFISKLFCYKFLDFIKSEQPDVIISTHFLVNELVSYLKGKEQIKTRIISVVTDFGVHSFWLAKNIDTYVAACDRTKEILISEQIDSEKIEVLGIPIRKQFQRQIDKDAVRKKLGINTGGFTSLILSGGIGIGPIYQIVNLLSKEINVIVICGNNEKLFFRLKKLNNSNLVVLGWIDYVQEVMAVCDVVVTKPGGSTISECLVMDLPMIFFSIIPGQELQNARIITQHGLGFIPKNPKKIKEKILSLRDNTGEITAIKNKISVFRQTDSSRRVLELIERR